jgi:hypothetical protein
MDLFCKLRKVYYIELLGDLNNKKNKIMKKILLGILLIASTSLVGCGGSWDNEVTKIGADLKRVDMKITQWSGGKAVKEWTIKKGYVSTEERSDGWFFKTDDGKLVRVSGTITIEEL